MMALANVDSPRTERGLAQLSRAAQLNGRPDIVLLEWDLDLLDEITGSRPRSHTLIRQLEKDGRLRRVRRGAYVIATRAGTINVGSLDLIAALTPVPYYVTAGRALSLHDLSDQHFRQVVVLVDTQRRGWTWRGDQVRYVRTQRRLLKSGARRTRKTRARVASAERAILDSLGHPAWSVTLAQVAEALDIELARNPGFSDRLADEAAFIGNASLARRVGYLVSLLVGPGEARPFLPLRGESKATTKLQTGGASTGPIDRVWKVRQNVEPERLLQHRRVM